MRKLHPLKEIKLVLFVILSIKELVNLFQQEKDLFLMFLAINLIFSARLHIWFGDWSNSFVCDRVYRYSRVLSTMMLSIFRMVFMMVFLIVRVSVTNILNWTIFY